MTGRVLPTVDAGQTGSVLLQLDCNARCPFCSTRVYTEQGLSSPVDWRAGVARRAKDYTQSLEELKHQYDLLWDAGTRHLTLQGGEPTLHPALCELIGYGWRKGFVEQTVVSNGRRFADADFTRRLVEAGPSTVVLSVFGHDAALHDASMGVTGAFDDLRAGVEALLKSGAGQPGRRPSLLAQFTLHAFNFHALPEMLAYWHRTGLRDFSVRLLRQTENTRRDQRDWFFDLSQLVIPLTEAVDFAATHPGTSLRFEELHRCLLPTSRLPAVLLDGGTNPNLARGHLQVARHFEAAQPSRRGPTADEICAGCELNAVCPKPEEPWAGRLSSPRRTIDVDAELKALALSPWPEGTAAHVRALIESPRLADVTSAHRHRLRARLIEDAKELGPGALASVLLSERVRCDVGQRLRAYGPSRTAVRFVSFAAAGVSELSPEAGAATVGSVKNAPMRQALAKHPFVAAEPHLGVWLLPPSPATGGRAIVTVLYDGTIVGEDVLASVIGWLLES